jgi:aspartate ammonia-lyase
MRIEKDFLGEIQIPNRLYYGIQTTRAMHNFNITGYELDRDFIVALGMVKAAAARANIRTSRMPELIGAAIVKAAEELHSGRRRNLNEHERQRGDCQPSPGNFGGQEGQL